MTCYWLNGCDPNASESEIFLIHPKLPQGPPTPFTTNVEYGYHYTSTFPHRMFGTLQDSLF
jgi:hypothetical protein